MLGPVLRIGCNSIGGLSRTGGLIPRLVLCGGIPLRGEVLLLRPGSLREKEIEAIARKVDAITAQLRDRRDKGTPYSSDEAYAAALIRYRAQISPLRGPCEDLKTRRLATTLEEKIASAWALLPTKKEAPRADLE